MKKRSFKVKAVMAVIVCLILTLGVTVTAYCGFDESAVGGDVQRDDSSSSSESSDSSSSSESSSPAPSSSESSSSESSHSDDSSSSSSDNWNVLEWEQQANQPQVAPQVTQPAVDLAALAALQAQQAAQAQTQKKAAPASKKQGTKPVAVFTKSADGSYDDVSSLFKSKDIDLFESSDRSIAYMNGSNLVPRKSGQVYIIAKRRTGKAKYDYQPVEKVLVKIDVPTLQDASTSKSSYDATKMMDSFGDTKIVAWKSSRPEVATIDEQGKVAATGTGTVLITATDQNGNKYRGRLTFK